MISLIAAIGKNNELGKNNTLVWSMPTDLKYFRQITSGHSVIMGRKTFESVGRPMPNRRNLIITRDLNYKKDGTIFWNRLSLSPVREPGSGAIRYVIGIQLDVTEVKLAKQHLMKFTRKHLMDSES